MSDATITPIAVMISGLLSAIEAANVGTVGADATRPARTEGWRPALRWALVAFVVSRLVVWVAAMSTIAIWGVFDQRATSFDSAGYGRLYGPLANDLLAPAVRWDSIWFLQIADTGYAGDSGRPAFFPLYPGIVWLLGQITSSIVVSGIVLSLACFLIGLTFFYRLAELEFGTGPARWGTMALALFPGAFWFSAIYSESLFLALSVGAVYYARTSRWWLAGVLGALAAATRSAGVLLLIPLALLWWDARREDTNRTGWGGLLAAGSVALGLLGVSLTMVALGLDFGAPFSAQEHWGRKFQGPWAGIWDGTSAAWDGVRQLVHGRAPPVYFEQAGGDPLAIARHNLLLWITLVVAAVPAAAAWRMLRPAHAAYATVALLLPLSYPVEPQPLMSLPRFVAVLYPLPLVVGVWLARGPRWRGVTLLGISSVWLAIVSGLVTNWRWVA